MRRLAITMIAASIIALRLHLAFRQHSDGGKIGSRRGPNEGRGESCACPNKLGVPANAGLGPRHNVEQALRVLKKKLQREGVFREMKRAAFYEKPSEKAAREKSEAIRRARKLARKQAIREGLIAAPVKKPNDRRPTRALPSVAPASPKLP